MAPWMFYLRWTMRYVVLLALLIATCGHAQEVKEPDQAVLQSCLLGTTEATWKALKLTPDQHRRMKFVQEACAEECKAAGMQGSKNPIVTKESDTVLDEVRNVLSTEQYRQWLSYCAGNGTPSR